MPDTLAVNVPSTFKRGQSLKLKLSDGREVTVAVPDDKRPGDTFEWTSPPLTKKKTQKIVLESSPPAKSPPPATRETIDVSVPPTWKRGQSLRLKLSDGREVAVSVPEDVKACESFTWAMPPPKPRRPSRSSFAGKDAKVQQSILAAEKKMLDEAQDEVAATSELFAQRREEGEAAAAPKLAPGSVQLIRKAADKLPADSPFQAQMLFLEKVEVEDL
tara:strand:- start:59 stop:709 length:651 start_codon:yes stop_codon:yes gene_type:complete